jgi:hypothetical protein
MITLNTVNNVLIIDVFSSSDMPEGLLTAGVTSTVGIDKLMEKKIIVYNGKEIKIAKMIESVKYAKNRIQNPA